jgi:tetratricopeptide (TPR) repeat protein
MKMIFRFFLACIMPALMCSFAWAQNSKKFTPPFSIRQADSLFFISAWKNAVPVYETVLGAAPENSLAWNRLGFCYHNLGDYDKAITNYSRALEYKPSPPLEATVRSRLARVYSLKKENEKAFVNMDKALNAGYANVSELQDHPDFANIRGDIRFEEAITRTNKNAMPCLTHPQSRQFDFWIGEWDVYPNGANVLVGQSKIEMASGGCMILEHWTAVGGAPNTGKSMNYVNAATGKWEQFWIGSGGITVNNPQKFVNGEYRDGAMRFDFEQVTPQGQKQTGRFIFYNEAPDRVRQFNEVSSDNGKTWTTVYDFIYKRKK